MFFGSDDGAFFDFESISRNRRLRYPWMPENRARLLAGNKNISIPKKEQGEIRILSADIALMSSKKNHNDATAIFINQMLKSKTSRYVNSIVYADSYEGLKTEEQALIIRKMFDEFDCDYLVLDTNGRNARLYGDIQNEVRKKSGRLKLLIRVEGYVQKHSHTQRIQVETVIQNIIPARVRTA